MEEITYQRPAAAPSWRHINPSARLQSLLLLALLAMTSVLFFARLDHTLLEPEEARYAEIPRQMLVESRFLTPVLHGEDYWQKPPLLYWLVMLSYQILGVHDWSARLVPCLAAIGSVIVTTLWGWRALNFWTGIASGTILALSVRFVYFAGMLTMDGLLCTCILAGLACGHLAQIELPQRRRWCVLSALACALGILTKGPVAFVLIAVPVLGFALLERGRWLTWGQAFLYLGIVAGVAGPWFLVMMCRDPAAAGTFFWLHHFVRYLAPFDHEKPAWFYVPSLLLGMMPWTLLLIPMLPSLCRQARRDCWRRPTALTFFALAFVWCVLFFSLSGCKRQGYILPAFPLLSLVLGTWVIQGWSWRRGGRIWARRLTFATLIMVLALSVTAALAELCSWRAAGLTVGAFAAAGLALAAWSRRAPAWNCWLGCAGMVFLLLCFGQRIWLPAYHERFGLRRQVELCSEYEQDETLAIVSYPRRWDSIGFYASRNDIESYSAGEREKLVRSLCSHGKTLIFVRRDGSLQELLQAMPEGMTIEVAAHQGNSVVVGLVRQKIPMDSP